MRFYDNKLSTEQKTTLSLYSEQIILPPKWFNGLFRRKNRCAY